MAVLVFAVILLFAGLRGDTVLLGAGENAENVTEMTLIGFVGEMSIGGLCP